MSTNEDRTLPATWEEYQRARREAWNRGAKDARYAFPADADTKHFVDWRCQQVRARYPITRKVPRAGIQLQPFVRAVIEESDPDDGNFVRVYNEGDPSIAVFLSRDSVRRLMDYAGDPFEEVSE